MPRVSQKTIEKLNDFICSLPEEAKGKCVLCNQTLVHIVKQAEAQTGAGTATVTKAIADSINKTAAPLDRVVAKSLEDKVHYADREGSIIEKSDNKSIEDLEKQAEQEILKQAKVLNAGKAAKKKQKLNDAKEANKAETRRTSITPVVHFKSCDDFLKDIEKQSVDLLITDPPYITDVEDIDVFASWLPGYLEIIKPTGRGYVFTGAYPDELKAYLSQEVPTHLKLKQVLGWSYKNTLGASPKMGYKLNWQAIFYYVGVDAPVLTCPVTAEQWSIQEINAPDGRQGDRFHKWQKPIEIAERFIRHSTQAGDLIIDPFACTGTFLLAAGKLGRRGIGCDIDKENLKIAESRGCQLV